MFGIYKSKFLLPYLALLAAVLSFTFSAFFVRWANVPPAVMSFYRMGIAATILTPFFLYKTTALCQTKSKHLLSNGILVFPVLAGLTLAIAQWFWSNSLGYTSVANASFLSNTSGLWVVLAAWIIFKERRNMPFWMGLCLAVCGAAVLLGNDFWGHPSFGLGDLLSLGAAIFNAAFYLLSQRSRQSLDTLTYVYIYTMISALALLIFCLATRSSLFGYSLHTYLAFLGAGILTQLIGYLALSYAMGHISASAVSPTLLGSAFLTSVLAIPILREPLKPVQWIGGLAVLSGIYLVNRYREISPHASTKLRVI